MKREREERVKRGEKNGRNEGKRHWEEKKEDKERNGGRMRFFSNYVSSVLSYK